MFVLLVVLSSLMNPAQAYYGRHSTEATLTFHGQADVKWSGAAATAELMNSAGEEHDKAVTLVRHQIQHLMGTFQSDSFRRDTAAAGALGETYDIHFTDDAQAGSARGRKLLSYDFRGTVVFQKEIFSGHETKLIPVRLPLAPDLIYGLSAVRSHGKERNRCTDSTYNEEEDFWYYWDPEMPSCPLAGNDQDVLHLTGKLERLPNTTVSYPEYDRLYGDNGNGNTLAIAVLIGYIRDQDVDAGKPSRRDEALHALRFIERDLNERGFEVTEKKDLFRVDGDSFTDGINYLRRYQKAVTVGTHTLDIQIEVLLADTDIDSTDETFHHYLAPALHNADIFLYDGHSNLGANFDLNKLPPMAFNKEKYQIFFFNGCSTYPYVNEMYFHAKGGTRNAEIITAGLPTFTDSSGPNAMAFMDHFLEGETLSYQKILSDLEKSNSGPATFLVGVKGDEDNVWRPEGR